MYYLGIDGGGTKTKACIMNEQQEIIFIGEGGPSSVDTVSLDETMKSINDAYSKFMSEHPHLTFEKAFIGLGGILSDDHGISYNKTFQSLPGNTPQTKIYIKNDMENALASGLLFDEGIVLICGTGSVAYGKNNKRQSHKVGGWGFREGDLGSSYDLGMRAMRHVVQTFDGRKVKSKFSEEISQVTHVKNTHDFVHIMKERYLDRTWIASLAKYVTKHAMLNDETACNIVKEATHELAHAIYTVADKLNLKDSSVVIVGSLGNADGFKDQLHSSIRYVLPNIKIIDSKIDPAVAAAMLALHLA